MKNTSMLNNDFNDDSTVKINEIYSLVWKYKHVILSFSFLCALLSAFVSLMLPNIYRSEALVAPVGDSKTSSIANQLGGLASLAGVNLNGASGVDKTILTIEMLRSREFINDFIIRHELTVLLFAVKDWDQKADKVIIDDTIYNETTKEWLRVVDFPKTSKPSTQESYKRFNELFNIDYDSLTSLIRISFEHESPRIAKHVLDDLINDINQKIRQKDISESESNVEYLKRQLNKTDLVQVRDAIYSLIEEQIKTSMLANVKSDYALRVIDPGIEPEQKFRPKRIVIVIISGLLGLLLSIFFIIVRFVIVQKRFKAVDKHELQ